MTPPRNQRTSRPARASAPDPRRNPRGVARRASRRRPRRAAVGRYRDSARSRLQRFRTGSMLAVGATGLLLLVSGAPAATPGPATGVAQEAPADVAPDTAPQDTAVAGPPGAAEAAPDSQPTDPGESARRATGTLRQLGRDLYTALPSIGIAIGLLLVAGLLAKLVRLGLRAVLSSWERAEATAALAAIGIWLLALGAALSVIAGDARALVGSLGLFGLALSWALQTPIESFTGWLLNSFRSYYRPGDRIAVGDVFGDVARIDFLTTTVFEAGGPQKRVQAAQSTGALVTFPNSEVLRSNITNFTRDFPYVWDELAVAVANESDIPRAVEVLRRVGDEVVGERMEAAAESYAALLEQARLAWDVATRPEVYVAARDAWTELTLRYLVPAREMRKWSSRLVLAIDEAFSEPGVAEHVHAAYPRNQVQPLPTPEWAQSAGSTEEEGKTK